MKQLKVKTLGPYSLRTKEKPVTWKQAELESPTSDLDWLINTLGPFLLTSKSPVHESIWICSTLI